MKNKLTRYSYNESSKYVIQDGKDLFSKTKGRWNKIFKNNNPIILELACGNGEYTVSRSMIELDKNFIGIDIKGARLWKGANILESNKSKNALFLRIQIESINDFFENGEVDEIIISFPDPRPKKRDINKRLTNRLFLDMYHKILSKKSKLMLKTDDKDLFDFSIKEIKNSKFKINDFTYDLYESKKFQTHRDIKTKYEVKFLNMGKKINFLSCLR